MYKSISSHFFYISLFLFSFIFLFIITTVESSSSSSSSPPLTLTLTNKNENNKNKNDNNNNNNNINKINPIVIIPGTGSNTIEAKLTGKKKTPHFFCKKKTNDFYNLWLDIKQLAPGTVDCWCDTILLQLNTSTLEYKNQNNVLTRIPEFGTLKAINELGLNKPDFRPWVKLTNKLINDMGYIDGENLHGAPYDFRYAAPGKTSYHGDDDFVLVKAIRLLIEETYHRNNQSKVILISHSMGGLQGYYFLKEMSVDWKEKYVKKWIPIAAAFGGTMKQMKLYASGDNQGISWVKDITVREEQRSYSSNLWLMPNPTIWGPEEVLVSTKTKNYTAHDTNDFLRDLKLHDYISVNNHLMKLTGDHVLNHPPGGVDIACIFSSGISTPERFAYDIEGDLNSQNAAEIKPDIFYGDGDGTLNRKSLSVCEKWFDDHDKNKNKNKMKIKNKNNDNSIIFKELKDLTHTGIIQDETAINFMIEQILS